MMNRANASWWTRKFSLVCAVGVAGLIWSTAAIWGQEEGKEEREGKEEKKEKEVELKALERIGLEVTVYQQGFALVKDMRRVALHEAENSLFWEDVPTHLDFTSLHLESLSDPQGFSVMMQDLLLTNVSPAQLLQDFIGKEITLVRYDKEGRVVQPLKGILLSVDGNQVASFQVGEQIYLYPQGTVILPMPPDELRVKPRIFIQAVSKLERTHNLLLSYITSGLNWQAEYSAIVSADESKIALEGAVVIRNESGANYPYAKLKLLAGEVGRIQRPIVLGERARRAAAEAMMVGPEFKEAPLFEYHIYELEQKVSLPDKQSKRLTLLSAPTIRSQKRFVFSPQIRYLHSQPQPLERGKVRVDFKFPNEEAHGLGKPLPAGRVRVYKQDGEGKLQFIGEDSLAHTGKGQDVEITTGYAFDLSAEHKVVERRRIGADVAEEDVEVELTNGKDEEVVVWVVQRFGSFWEILKTSHDYTKRDASTVEFKVPVKQNGKAKLTYTVRLKG